MIYAKQLNYWNDNIKNIQYRSKDIYGNARDAMKKYVKDKYKKSYADICVWNPDALKIHTQTIFIDESGFFQLVSRSKKTRSRKIITKKYCLHYSPIENYANKIRKIQQD